MADPRRRVPRTDVLLADPRLAAAERVLGRALVKSVVAQAQQRARAGEIEPDQVAEHAVAALPAGAASLRPVINATGVVVHTNLGRAPLSQAALDAVVTAGGATDVEFDLETGRRARRGRGALAALARAVPDRGRCARRQQQRRRAAADRHDPGARQGDRDQPRRADRDRRRLPAARADGVDRFATSARSAPPTAPTCATTPTRSGPDTGFLLKVHPSNYHVTGFTSAVPVAELAELDVPLVVDIGSGLLTPHPLLPDEPDATTVLRDGADLVTASGDKLLGGPQAGLLFGDAELIERLRRHPAARALRVDKLTLAALEATLVGPPPPVAQALDGRRGRAAGAGRTARRPAARRAGGGLYRRRRRRRSAPAWSCPAPPSACPSPTPRRCAPAPRRSSGVSRAAAACSICARSRPRTTSAR